MTQLLLYFILTSGGKGGFRGDRKRRGSPVPDSIATKISK